MRYIPQSLLDQGPQPAYIVWLDHSTGDTDKPAWVGKDGLDASVVKVQSCCYVVAEYETHFVVSHSVSKDPGPDGEWEYVQPFYIVKGVVTEFRLLRKKAA